MKKVTKKQNKAFLGEYDALRAAFAKVNLREAATPMVRGKIVEDTDTYNKVQQLLDCPDMEHVHKFLLDIDFDEITPEIKQKVDDLYQLAVSQGYVESFSDSDENEVNNEDEVSDEDEEQEEVADTAGFEKAVSNDVSKENAAKKDTLEINAPVLNTPAYVLFYSAMKDGEIRTGECYSNAVTAENAKMDAVQKLQKLGFTAIEIIASEMADPNSRGAKDNISKFGEKDYEEASDDELDFNVDDDTISEAEEDKNEESDKENDENSEEDEEAAEEEKDEELSRAEKLDYFKHYLEEFKSLLQKMKAETYVDMSLADRAKFYDEMSKIWKGNPDPSTFMTDDNVKQIEHMKIKIAK